MSGYTVAILGSGPAGLMAAHACALTGTSFAVFTNSTGSHITGAQYLHKPIPGLTEEEPDFLIMNVVRGDSDHYRQKIYGSAFGTLLASQDVSFDEARLNPFVGAWNLKSAYERLYELYLPSFNVVSNVKPMMDQLHKDFDKIVSSVPAQALCLSPQHQWKGAQVYIDEKAPSDMESDTVVYEGTKDRSWYRASLVQGAGGTEYGSTAASPLPPGFAGHTIIKPTWTDCDCWPEVIRIGRYGKWTKGVLVHDAFEEIYRWRQALA